jgi:hypothetical protein
MDGGEVQHGFAHLGQFLIVFAEAAIATEPGEGPLHDPAARQEHEAALPGRALHDGDLQLEQVTRVLDQLAAIRLVGPDQQQRDEMAGPFEQQPGPAFRVRFPGRVDVRREQEAECVDQHLALAPGHLFSPHRSRAPRRPRSS